MFFYRPAHVPDNCPNFTGTCGLMEQLDIEQMDRLATRELGVEVAPSATPEKAASRLWSIWKAKYPVRDLVRPVGLPEVGRITALGHHDVVNQLPVYKVYAIYDPVKDRDKFKARDKKFWKMYRQVLMFYWRIAEFGEIGLERSALKAWAIENWHLFHSRQDPEKLLRWSIRRLAVYGFIVVQRYSTHKDARDQGVNVNALTRYRRRITSNTRYGVENFYSNFDDFVFARADEEENP